MRRATSAKRATQRLRRTVKKPLDMKTQDKLRKALRAKCGPRPDERFFRKYDRDRSGELSVQEVEEMFRTGLKITKREASPADVRALVAAMDADGSGTLSLAELAAFVGNRPVSPGKSKMKRRMIKKTTAFFPSSNANEPLAPPYRALPVLQTSRHVEGRVDGVWGGNPRLGRGLRGRANRRTRTHPGTRASRRRADDLNVTWSGPRRRDVVDVAVREYE